MIGDYFHGFFLSHEEAEALVFFVAEDFGFSDSAFTPGLFSGSFV